MSRQWQVGVDIGGTFTDVVGIHRTAGTTRAAKVRSTPGAPIASLDAALAAIELSWADVADLMHGTTMATNAMVEGKLPRVALIATQGFRDVLAIARQNRADLYRLDALPKLPPLVPEDSRFEVEERLDASGAVLVPLRPETVQRAVAQVCGAGVEAVAIALLHAYANPVHEAMLGEKLRERLAYVVESAQVNPEAREYERTSTAVLNATLMPLTASYIDRLLEHSGEEVGVHLVHSAGGMASPAAVKERPLGLVLSGPAAGVAATCQIATELRLDNVISFDMGGTTTDVCLVVDGAAQIASQRLLAGRPLRQPMVAVESIGAGGGSIARIDSGAFRVGPDSAGADPGPACYGTGGTLPTVTDANLVLGFLTPDRRLGAQVEVDRERAVAAIHPLAKVLGASLVQAAQGIHQVANANMARALKRVTVERGIDARQCALVAYGGAGPMHAVELARLFGITQVVVPRLSSMFSALGCLTAELSYAQQRSVRMLSEAWDAERLAAIRADLVQQLSRPLLAGGCSRADLRIDQVAGVRYAGQSYAVEVPCTSPVDVATLDASFKREHHKQYGFTTEEPWELEFLRVRAAAPPLRTMEPPRTGRPPPVPREPVSTRCWFTADRDSETARYQRAALTRAERIEGPALIEDDWSTVVVNPGAVASADEHGHLHIEVGVAP